VVFCFVFITTFTYPSCFYHLFRFLAGERSPDRSRVTEAWTFTELFFIWFFSSNCARWSLQFFFTFFWVGSLASSIKHVFPVFFLFFVFSDSSILNLMDLGIAVTEITTEVFLFFSAQWRRE